MIRSVPLDDLLLDCFERRVIALLTAAVEAMRDRPTTPVADAFAGIRELAWRCDERAAWASRPAEREGAREEALYVRRCASAVARLERESQRIRKGVGA